MEAVREANGRRALRPAETIDAAALDVEAFLVVPAWAEGETAADVSADTLREVYGIDAARDPLAWMLYTEGARRLGFPGPVPIPAQAWAGTGPGETGASALA